MKKSLLSLVMIQAAMMGFAQTGKLWKKANSVTNKSTIAENKINLKNAKLYSLDFEGLKNTIKNAPQSYDNTLSNVIVSFPNSNGELEDFRIYEKSNFDPALQEKYSDIRSYVGESIFGDTKIYFSVSPLGLSTMGLNSDKSTDIIEPYTSDLSTYAVFKRTDDKGFAKEFICSVPNANKGTKATSTDKSADDGKLRNYRLALSCTGEYGAYFGGKSGAMAAMNNTMTRVNGVFENDFAIHLTIIPENENIVFTNSSTDPYSAATTGVNGAWSTELMDVLHGTTYGIGDSKFDIGHLFGRSGGGGSAGCIGCVCNNSTTYDSSWDWYWYKGQGYTSPGSGAPSGDNFDIDYVAHEIGHQFGGFHTFTHGTEGSLNPSQMEPGSGSTIMGYAGITSKDVQAHSDPYFHAASLRDITNYMKSAAGNCSTTTASGNNAPVVNAGPDYTIPKSTPFILTGTATDADGDAMTYTWEQFDLQNSSTANPSATKTTGVNYRSYPPTSSPVRYLPNMTTVLAGRLYTAGSEINVEYLSSVARTLNFRFTARDNRTGAGANAYDDMKVTVNSAAGPFKVTSPNTAVTYSGNSTQTVTWDVASTTASPINCSTVDILISTDGGTTWSTLLENTPNDGSQAVTIPDVATTQGRIMVKANGNIFFDVSDANFTINALAVSDVQKQQISIYPNPAKDVINITNLKSSANYEITNAIGDIVNKGIVENGKINVSKLTKGVYIITFNTKEGKTSTKFIKE